MVAYFLSYVIFKEPSRVFGHASLAVSQFSKGDAAPQIVFRIGLLRPSQVQLEDFIKPKVGREFFHKTYPISQHDLAILLHRINRDRSKDGDEMSQFREENDFGSLPGGPKHHWITNNCKTYAISVMKSVGIQDETLENLGIDIPIWSGDLHPLSFATIEGEDKLNWTCPFIVANRDDYQSFQPDEMQELKQLRPKKGRVTSQGCPI